jgi:hypothetical protein
LIDEKEGLSILGIIVVTKRFSFTSEILQSEVEFIVSKNRSRDYLTGDKES